MLKRNPWLMLISYLDDFLWSRYGLPHAGWLPSCNCGGADVYNELGCFNLSCVSCGCGSVSAAFQTNIPANATVVMGWLRAPTITFPNRGFHNQIWSRQVNAPPWPAIVDPVPIPIADPLKYPEIDPRYIPAIDPEALPIAEPVPEPEPLPYRELPNRRPDINRNPNYQRNVGPRPGEITGPGFGRPTTNPTPTRRPPDRRTFERKVVVTVHPRSWLGRIGNWVTETKDVVDALHEALPDEFKTQKKIRNAVTRVEASPQQKLLDVWDAVQPGVMNDAQWEQFMKDALLNIVKNQLEDKFYGTLGKLGGKAGQRLGRPVGHGTGLAH